MDPNPTTETAHAYTAYKRVDKKIKPVSTTQPTGSHVHRTIPEDPLLTLPYLTKNPPVFKPSARISQERLDELEVNKDTFLTEEEEKLFSHIMQLNEDALAWEDIERGTLKDSYFSPYVIPTVPHIPWEDKNIPIPP
ncbi:hypothetical protein B0H10DRAFT_1855646, partial [Mycena sp. CBHHK59/15]